MLLPFMVLSLYSVMRGIPPVQMQAASSLGAKWPRAFRGCTCRSPCPASAPAA